MYEVFAYAERNPIELESAYPYKAVDGRCHAKGGEVEDNSYVNVRVNSRAAFLQALQVGPLSIAIEADTSVFQFYNGGVLNSSRCGTRTDHGVLAVGYGGSGDNVYYIVKNSWGASWGESGYIKIASGQASGPGICGIQSDPAYPTGAYGVAK
jgi:C1A family cysteine protease